MSHQHQRSPATFWGHYHCRPPSAPLHCTNCGGPVVRQTIRRWGWAFRYQHAKGGVTCNRPVNLKRFCGCHEGPKLP